MALLVLIALLTIAFFTPWYRRSLDSFYFDSFIDFLNLLQSGLTSGQSFDSAIRSAAHLEQEQRCYAQTAARVLEKAIDLGINGGELFRKMEKQFPIDESRLYTRMIQLSRSTGGSMSRITDVTLEKLYTRFRAVSDGQAVIYQKQLEQRVLCIAPLMVIFFIQHSQSQFLEVMYTNPKGVLVMTFSFFLLVIMKYVGEWVIRGVK